MKKFTFSILLLLNSCLISKIEKTTDVINIHFGSGGGVTGELIEYHLNSKGEIFQKGVKIKTLDAKATLEVFEKADKIKDIKFKDSGNLYSFLKINRKNEGNRITWSVTSTELDHRIKYLHKKLITLSKTQTP